MGVNYSDIIERMRWASKLKNDSAVARRLGVTPQALSNYKKRGAMPTDLVLRFSNIYGLSMDWLLTGEGEMYKTGAHSEAENRGVLNAAEDAASYGKAVKRHADFAALSPDEIIYVGKLLKILRSQNKTAAASIRHTLDAFLKVSEAAPPDALPESAKEREKK